MFIQFKLLFKFARQGLRTTPLRLMVFAQALAIAAQLSVLLTADRYQQLFTQEAQALLGGDLVVNADREPTLDVQAAITMSGLSLAKTISFNSVVLSPNSDKQTLVSAKAVDTTYPLRGSITLAAQLTPQKNAPSVGTVWVGAAVLKSLDLKLGDTLQLGERRFIIAAEIAVEPDRGVQFISFAPRVMLAQADLAATGLLGVGSRATYRWQMVGNITAQNQFKEWFKTHNTGGQRLETLSDGRPETRIALDRASHFLGLIAILTTLIAACGLGLVAHIWAREQAQLVTLLRTLGASRNRVLSHLLGQVGWASILGLSFGVAAGYGLHSVLAQWLVTTQGVVLPAAGYGPYLQAVLLLVVLLIACVVGVVQSLLNTQPIHILRGQAIQPLSWALRWVYYGLTVLTLAILLIWVAGDIKQGFIVLIVLISVALLAVLLVYGLIQLALRLGRQHSLWVVRTAARGLLRNPVLTTVQAATLTFALLGILMLGSLQRDVLGAWQTVLPADAPNYFVFNIQPDQAVAVQNKLIELGIIKVKLQPMIRARLIQINNTAVNLDSYSEERAKNLVNREFNMSYSNTLPEGNTVEAGRWHGNSINNTNHQVISNEISMEAGVLKTLGLKLGDILTFDVAGQLVKYTLTSVRKLHWESLNVNFFVIASPISTPIAVSDLPQTYIAAVFVPSSTDITHLVRQFSNLTVLDVGVITAQGQAILDKVSRALQLLFGLGVLAGAVVVTIIAYASRLARLRETALLRVLGASWAQVQTAQVLEQATIGGLAGLIAGVASYGAVQVLAANILELSVNVGVWPMWLGVLLGVMVNVVGYFVLQIEWRRVPLGTQVRSLGL